MDETTAALALAWGNEWSSTVAATVTTSTTAFFQRIRQVRREIHHDFSAREASVAPPKAAPKLSSKQLAVKMLSRAPPPVVMNAEFDEEDETPNSGTRQQRRNKRCCNCVHGRDVAHAAQAPGLQS